MFHLDRLSHQLPVSFVTSLKDHRLEPDFSEHCICTSWNFLSHRFESTWVWEPWTLTSGLLSNSKPTAGSCPPSTWSAPRCAVRLKCIVFYFFSYRFLSRISSPGLCWQWSERPQVFFQPSCLCGRGSPPSDVKSSTVAKTGPRLVFNKTRFHQLDNAMVTWTRCSLVRTGRLMAPTMWSCHKILMSHSHIIKMDIRFHCHCGKGSALILIMSWFQILCSCSPLQIQGES